MSERRVGIVVEPQTAAEAEGVTIQRSIGGERLVLLDPYLLLDHLMLPASSGTPVGFPRHPHRGIETHTYVLAGQVHHKDSLGNDSRVGVNGSQWMTAGGGIFHEEYLEAGPDGCEALQLWFNLPAAQKMTRPEYRAAYAADIPEITLAEGARARVVAGAAGGVQGAFQGIAVRPTYLDVWLSPNSTIALPALSEETAFAYMVRGQAVFGTEAGARSVTAPHLVIFSDGDTVQATAGSQEEARFVFVSAKPLYEPVMQYRSIVMNTVEQMREALEDLEKEVLSHDKDGAMAYLIGIDIGTSGTKAILIDETGKVLARATEEYPLYTPRPQWSEQDPLDWWNASAATVRKVLDTSGIDAREVNGVGLSGQMHGSVFLDENDTVLRRALLWNDQRTQAECDWIMETVGREKVVEQISNPVLTGFTAGKIVWLRNHEPELYARVKKVLLPKDYVRLKLTGEYATEVSDASGTALFNVRKRAWADEMLGLIGIPRDWMPTAYESPEVSGRITEAATAATGLAPGTPVVGGGGDQAAGAVGNGIVETGVVSSTVGTSGVVFAFSDEPRVDPLLRLHTFCHAVPGKWHLMGVMLSAGGSLQWYRDAFCQPEKVVAGAIGHDPYELICAEAARAPVGSEGLIFLPYLTGERTPYPDANARGVLFGLTRRTDRTFVARAVLEGVAYGLRDSFAIMEEMQLPIREVRASGGGARSRIWRQIMADVIGHNHVTINVDEGPALGVALLAGVGTGVYRSVAEACRATIRVSDQTAVCNPNHVAYTRFHQVYQSLYAHLKSDFAAISQLMPV